MTYSKNRALKIICTAAITSVLASGLTACGHPDNPLKKASIEQLQTAYSQLKESDRACIDGIAARSKNSPYKEPADLYQRCQARYPLIANTFSNAIGKKISVSDLKGADFWLAFFKKNQQRIESLTE